jgi:hypothetical protein
VGTYSLTSVDGSDIQLSAQVGKNIANADLKAGTYQANTAQFVSGYRTPNAISAGVCSSSNSASMQLTLRLMVLLLVQH